MDERTYLLAQGFHHFMLLQTVVYAWKFRVRAAAAVMKYYQQLENARRRRRRRWWMKPWLRNRSAMGFSDTLVRELAAHDPEAHRQLLGVDLDFYEFLLHRLEPRITHDDTNFRKAIPGRTRLQIALRYYRLGGDYQTIAFEFRVGRSTVHKVLKETTHAIIQEFCDEVLLCPTDPEEWLRISNNWLNDTQMPHVLGAMDGTHIRITKPANSGSVYYNYKGYFSIVLMALVDANYKFLWCDIGATGGSSDAQIFNHSTLPEMIHTGAIGFPPPEPLPNEDYPLPYYIISDDAFALRVWNQKPYPDRRLTRAMRCYNYRLSRARMRVECTFGLLKCKFRAMGSGVNQYPDMAKAVTSACVILHNLLRIRCPRAHHDIMDSYDNNGKLIPGEWRQFHGEAATVAPPPLRGDRGTAPAHEVRNYLAEYLSDPNRGACEWQWDKL